MKIATLVKTLQAQVQTKAEAAQKVAQKAEGELDAASAAVDRAQEALDRNVDKVAGKAAEVIDRATAPVNEALDRLGERGVQQSSFEANPTFDREVRLRLGQELPEDYLTTEGKVGRMDRALGSVLDRIGERSAEGSFSKNINGIQTAGTFGRSDGKTSGEYALTLGRLNMQGQGRISVSAGRLEAQGQIDIDATLIDARVRAQVKLGAFEAKGDAELYVGGRLRADGSVVLDPKRGVYAAHLNADMYVGVRAGIKGEASLGEYASASGGIGLRAGVGVTVSAHAGLKDGKLTAGLDLGAALGIGLDIKLHVSVDFKKIADKAKQLVEGPWKVVENAAATIKDAGAKIAGAAKNIFGGIKSVFGGGKKKAKPTVNQAKVDAAPASAANAASTIQKLGSSLLETLKTRTPSAPRLATQIRG
jgi:hypothetical protein